MPDPKPEPKQAPPPAEAKPTPPPPATTDYSPEFREMIMLAGAVVSSRMFPGIDTKEKALVLMGLARSEGLNFMQAFRQYDIIQNRPAMKSGTLLAKFQKAGGKVNWTEMSDKRAAATWFAPGIVNPVEISFTIEEAQRAGLAGKDNWKHYPADMLIARCIARGVRRTMAGIAEGVLTVEEAQDLEPLYQTKPPPTDEERNLAPMAGKVEAVTEPTPEGNA
jgi:hypothetical protein